METGTASRRVFSGRYQVEELLRSGGMAAVWRGRDLRLDRPVAIKELAGPWLGDPTAVTRFDREARTAARLAHPNIVAVHDVGVDEDSRYLVMELIDGVTVAEMLADGPFPVAKAIGIAAQTCEGLAAAHAAGVVHRDIKPANLMLTGAGVVKICDFGIARALAGAGDPNLTGPSHAIGTSAYMSPEQASGEPVDARADLYALGCTLYAMLAGAPPFAGDAVEVVRQHLNDPPAPLSEHRADVPLALAELVAQLLAKSPAERPADAAEVKSRLAALLDQAPAVLPAGAAGPGLPVRVAGRATVRRPSAVPISRERRVIAAGVVIALAAFLVSVVAMSLSVPSGAAGSSGAVLDDPTAPSVPASSLSPAAAPPAATQSGRSTQQRGPAAPSSQPQPSDPIAALRLSIQQQVSTGNLNPDKASDLYKKVDDIARAMNAGNAGDTTRAIKALRDKLASLRGEGQLTAAGYDDLISHLDLVAAALP